MLLSLGVGTAFADLVPLGANSLQGEGLGHVDTVLTMQSPGSSTMESGCVGAGPGGTTVKAPLYAPLEVAQMVAMHSPAGMNRPSITFSQPHRWV